jgi:hypothetical protein
LKLRITVENDIALEVVPRLVVTTASVLLAFGDYRMVFGSVGGLLLSVRRKANAGEKKKQHHYLLHIVGSFRPVS